jgi:hypothetical protein
LAPQAVPQAPQLAPSVIVFVHWPLQLVSPGAQPLVELQAPC